MALTAERREGAPNRRPSVLRESEPNTDLIRGVAVQHRLPHPRFSQLWDAIVLDGDQKDRLLSQALLSFTLRSRIEAARLPMHGLIMLVGPPGTGKTSLARGLASRTAEVFDGAGSFEYLEVEPHAVSNSGLGRSQQAVRRLLNEVIAERAESSRLIVLIDEVETLAPARAKLSFDANPVDVHRASDAVLAGLDQLAADHPNLLFVATSNFPEAVDAALLSRADLIESIPLPSMNTARAILADAVSALAEHYSAAAQILDDPDFVRAAAACQDWTVGRSARWCCRPAPWISARRWIPDD